MGLQRCVVLRELLIHVLIPLEGTKFVNSLPNEKLGEVAMKYIQKEKEIALLKSALESTEMGQEEKGRILTLLEKGGVRTELMLD